MLEYVVADDKARVAEDFLETIRTEVETTTEFRIHGPDGQPVWLEERGSLVRGEGGQIIGITGALRDITGRKKGEEEQRQLETQLRQSQKMEAIGLLAGGIAHDFNNILAAMMMEIDLMKETAGLDDDAIKGLRELKEGCNRAAGLTRHLLAFGRRSVLELKPLDLIEVVKGMLSMLERLLGEDVKIHLVQSQEHFPAIEGDAAVLEQVLMNLCVNARDAMPRGGIITISIRIQEVGGAQILAYPDAKEGRFLCLELTDTGCGMDADTLKHMFDPYFTTKELGKGTGLGLATVQGTIVQHGGWIEADSVQGKGTTFRVYLPESDQALDTLPPAPVHAPASGQGTILLVEDNSTVRRTIARMLQRMGYAVLEADCGREALEKWHDHAGNIELLLTDVVLPEGVTGWELAEKLKARHPNLRVIVSSGYNDEILDRKGSTGPESTYLAKPYTRVELEKAIRQALT